MGMGPPPGYRNTSAKNFARMRLRELAMAEEQYYNESNKYTADLSQLMLARRTGDVVVLRILSAGHSGDHDRSHPAARRARHGL
jgi:hypothetical protein